MPLKKNENETELKTLFPVEVAECKKERKKE